MSENGERSPSPVDQGRLRQRSPSASSENSKESERSHESRSRSRSYHRSRSRSRSKEYKKRQRSYSSSRSRSRGRHSPYRRNSYRSRSRSPPPYRGGGRYRDNPESSSCLGVFGLSLYTQERDLREVFSRYGHIDDINTGRSRGFAFAKDRCTGIEIDGRRIRVDYSITERAHTPTPGIYLGKPTSRGSGYGRRRSPSPYYNRRSSRYSRSRSRSRSYSPRKSVLIVVAEIEITKSLGDEDRKIGLNEDSCH
ncbi:hypothetical protein KUTeg_008192 [Tegillarca granosa]|uniref:RRM domain-containing protein n=1 Tax=Tegillarca granosa TaxID=220873 RepID=A0ABQ9FBK6_TEGGR|nr:hypothetical protein KUTeg_008192 [Tegillarca granosa]